MTQAVTTPTFSTEPASGLIGATLDGFDLDAVLADLDQQQRLRDALLEHLVLVLPRLDPTPEQHVALARVFGEPEPPEDYNPAHPDHPEICVFDSEGGYKADKWHVDVSWKEVIPDAALLCMRQSPPVGGDTLWASTYAAYDGLSNGMKQLLGNRRAIHEISPEYQTEHPVVVTHPETGRKLLFVNEVFTRNIVNLPPDEGDALLPFLMRHCYRPEYTYRHRWSEGDVVIWDNRATQHYAVFDFEGRRVVHRVGIAGGTPSA